MSGSDKSIVTMYETLGMSIEEIHQEDGWDLVSIKACLMQNSPVYRERVKCKMEDGFNEQDNRDSLQVVREAMHGEDEHVRLRAAIFLREDYKGRRDVKASDLSRMGGITINQFNTYLQQANEARERAKSINNKVVDCKELSIKSSG